MHKPPKKLLDQVREKLRLKHYSIRTEDAYVSWIRRFIFYHNKKHPKEMGESEVEAFLSHLAVDLKVASSTQNQALNALLFLYRYVLGKDLKAINAVRAKKPKKMPTVMTQSEVSKVLKGMSGVHKLMAMMIYGSGLRLMECIRLRVKDIDFEMNQIVVRDGKGAKDRVTILAENVKIDLKAHLEKVRLIHKDVNTTMIYTHVLQKGAKAVRSPVDLLD